MAFMSGSPKRLAWTLWAVLTTAIGGYAAYALSVDGADRTAFLPGPTSAGHHQLELACDVCHTEAFGGGEVLQDACIQCHGAELKAVHDSHPLTKFTDPRNADRVAKLDARRCITCHTEHRPGITGAMGVSVPTDFCVHCHHDIAEERPSHAGFDFAGCADGGCHNFHDNQALYEDFLLKHMNEPALLATPRISRTNLGRHITRLPTYPEHDYQPRPLALQDRDAPSVHLSDPLISEEWVGTAHGRAGANCSACHRAPDDNGTWRDRPGHAACVRCHGPETEGFLAGRHGMTLAQGLSPLTPSQARLPMRPLAAHAELGCAACHPAHRFDTRHAAVDACLGCHDDGHSRGYRDSPHYRQWLRELAGQAPAGSGVTCATCHLPRVPHKDGDVERVLVQHNQNDTLRPNEKMLRPVCMQCHGLGFALDALADGALIKRNFAGAPALHVQSLDMAARRVPELDQGGEPMR